MIRKIIYTISVNLQDGGSIDITIATTDKSRLPAIIENNKMRIEYGARQVMTGWRFIKEDYATLNLEFTQYETMVSACDFVDDNDDTAGDSSAIVDTSQYFKSVPSINV